MAKLDKSRLLKHLLPVRTEAAPLAPAGTRTNLPRRLHFFSGAPQDERERLAACVREPTGGSEDCEEVLET